MLGDRDVELKGAHLSGKRIDLIVAGGIAAIESPRLVRELRRYGADVRVIMTEAATKFVTPLVFEWASKNLVVTELSGSAEHITSADCIVVAPATLDFLAKASWGFADSAALTLLQSALGRKPIFFAPSMHESLGENPLFKENVARLKKIKGVRFLEPSKSEGKSKLQDIEAIAAHVCHGAGAPSKLRGESVLISVGPTRSYVDDMRFLSNRSTGALGLTIADDLYRSGADVSIVAGPLQVQVPSWLETKKVETNLEMVDAMKKLALRHKPKAMVFAAAVLDFDVKKAKKEKVSSKNGFSVSLTPSEKLIRSFRATKCLKIGFKLESRVTDKELIARARQSLHENKANLVVANRLEDVSSRSHRAFIVSASGRPIECEGRATIARKLIEELQSLS